MTFQGFLRVAAATVPVRLADCAANVDRALETMARAESEGVDILVFPELSITGYTCADLFQQLSLQRQAQAALLRIARESRSIFAGVAMVGLPLRADDQLFNCAAVIQDGRILGIVPKSFVPNYKEFYEARWFAAAGTARSTHLVLDGQDIPFGADLLFESTDREGPVLGVEICEDLWVPVPPSSDQALQGATILVNLSASNEVIGKSDYRRQLVVNQSARCLATYVYASCGVGESTTDVVFGGHCLIAENGVLLAESARFQRAPALLIADTDLDRLRVDRYRTNCFRDARLGRGPAVDYRRIPFHSSPKSKDVDGMLYRAVEAHPFVPAGQEQLHERCEEIFNTQVTGLVGRLEHVGKPLLAIGISGGLDSTLALLVACKAVDALKIRRERIRAFTLPGFGTTARTRANAIALMRHLDVLGAEVDIRSLCLDEMKALGHCPFGIPLEGLDAGALAERLRQLPVDQNQDLVFENVQARMRTSILMNAGFVVGTGDLSEFAVGWCTYNGDHMSMYNPNVSIPKTLVKFLVRWAAENEFAGEARSTLLDIVATEISPELLPPGRDGTATHCTEATIGPYELVDFFLYHFLRFGTPPEKILNLAGRARFDREYATPEIRKWLRIFLERFFKNQFKRSCLPDGPKVGSVSISPRGDWRMPSDAQVGEWLTSLETGEEDRPSRGAATTPKDRKVGRS